MKELNKKIIMGLYESMLLIRRSEETLIRLHPEQKMKTPFHLYIGQEAIASGICFSMNKKDLVFSYHRSHGHYLAKGGNIKKFFAEMYNKSTGCSGGKGGSMHLIDTSVGHMGSSSIVAGSIPIAVGAALALKKNNKKNVVVSFFGDGSVDEGVLYESFNFSSLHNLNIIFVCEDNELSVNTPISERRAKDNMVQRANSFGIISKELNGNNVIEIYKNFKKIRNEQLVKSGPYFLECKTYRHKGHIGIDDDLIDKIRTREYLERWKKKCPIKYLKKKLLKNKITSIKDLGLLEKKIEKIIIEADKFGRTSPLPKKQDLLKGVFA